MSTDYAAPVYSNLKRSTLSYDEELAISPEAEAMIAAMPVSDRTPTEEQVEQLMREYEIHIECDLAAGPGTATVLFTDLSHAYIDENRTTS